MMYWVGVGRFNRDKNLAKERMHGYIEIKPHFRFINRNGRERDWDLGLPGVFSDVI